MLLDLLPLLQEAETSPVVVAPPSRASRPQLNPPRPHFPPRHRPVETELVAAGSVTSTLDVLRLYLSDEEELVLVGVI